MSAEIPVVINGDASSDAKIVITYPIPSHAGWPKEYALQHPQKFDVKIPKGTKHIRIGTTPSIGGYQFLDVEEKDDRLKISLATWCYEFKLEIGFVGDWSFCY
jgi:hypothetical protein